jgi:hypothetical protein
MGITAIERLLSSHGFDLARQNKHKVYKREDGTTFVTASTPSDWRAERNQISTLCRVLGTDKRILLASLERRRQRIRAVPAPAALPNAAPPPLAIEKAPTREEKTLTKRIARIERKRAAEAARRAKRLDLFFKRHAFLFVDSGEVIFADYRGMKLFWKKLARRITRPRTSTNALSDCYGHGADITAEEILTNPEVLCLFNCPHSGVSFVFKDGSVVDSNPETAREVRDELKASC